MNINQPRNTYAIEAEDLIVQRLFQAVVSKKLSGPGYFLDIGAFHPINHSNTYLLYLDGWRGVNVEPNPDTFEDFARYRPEDRNINIGISDRASSLLYHRFQDPLVNGFFSQAHVDMLVERGYIYLGSEQITCVGINDFLAANVNTEIDFLNIDIETNEGVVFAEWNWRDFKPKVICAEIFAVGVADVLESPVARILSQNDYVLVSRVFHSAFFVHSSAL